MKKNIIIFGLTIILFLSCCICINFRKKSFESISFDTSNIYGNTNGNISNNAFVAKQGKWIYCHKSHNMFAFNCDSGKKVNLTWRGGDDINVVGNLIFFTRSSGLSGFDSSDLYCFDLRESKQYKINGIITQNIIAYNGWLYYINSVSTPFNCLYKAKYDGTEIKRLTDFSVSEFCIIGDRIFTSTNDIKILSLDGDIIHKIDFENELKELSKQNILFVDNDMYFIAGYQKSYGIAKLNMNSLEYTQIINEHCSNFNIQDEWIYFVKEKDQKLYKVKLNGNGEQQIGNVVVGRTGINIADDWVYYYQDNTLYRIKTDGSICEKL